MKCGEMASTSVQPALMLWQSLARGAGLVAFQPSRRQIPAGVLWVVAAAHPPVLALTPPSAEVSPARFCRPLSLRKTFHFADVVAGCGWPAKSLRSLTRAG